MKSLKVEEDEEAKAKHDEEFEKHKAMFLEKKEKISREMRDQGYSPSSGVYLLNEEPESCTIL